MFAESPSANIYKLVLQFFCFVLFFLEENVAWNGEIPMYSSISYSAIHLSLLHL